MVLIKPNNSIAMIFLLIMRRLKQYKQCGFKVRSFILYMSFWHNLSAVFNMPELAAPLYGLWGGGIDAAGVLTEVYCEFNQ